MLGTAFPYRPFLPEDVPVIQVDVRGEHIGRRTRVTHPLVGTVADTVPALAQLVQAKTDSSFHVRVVGHYRTRRRKLDELTHSAPTQTPMHPQTVADAIDRLADEDVLFTADVGLPTVWLARYVHTNGRRRVVGSFNHGSRANVLPHAIGLQAAAPDRQVVSMSGDGGIAMMLGDRHPRATRRASRGPRQCAEQRARARPALIDATVARQELNLPPTITAGQVKGVSLFLTGSILDGRASEILELARTNLRHL